MQQAWGATVQPGDVIAGRYRVEALVGQGGFGAVFRAVQLPMGRTVAIKVMLPQALTSVDGLARFRREAELAQRLEHPNTVRMYDFGEAENGAPFIAWEFLKGQSLEAALKSGGGLAVSRVAHIGAQALKSLMEAHALGIVHRDIKPSNLFLCDFTGEHDYVKVLDFGIARVEGSVVTLGGSMLGTPAYMSPEQVSGAKVTAASDIYALGLVLAEALDGRPVYHGDSGLGIAMGQLSNDPPPLPDAALRSVLAPVIVQATQKNVARRFQSARQMLEAIARIEPASLRSAEGRAVIKVAAGAGTIVMEQSPDTALAPQDVGANANSTWDDRAPSASAASAPAEGRSSPGRPAPTERPDVFAPSQMMSPAAASMPSGAAALEPPLVHTMVPPTVTDGGIAREDSEAGRAYARDSVTRGARRLAATAPLGPPDERGVPSAPVIASGANAAPRSRVRAIAIGAAATALAVIGVVVAYTEFGAPRTPAPAPTALFPLHPRDVHTTDLAPDRAHAASRVHLATLTGPKLHERLVQLGWKVISESNSEVATARQSMVVATLGDKNASFLLMHFGDDYSAPVHENAMRQSGSAIRDGNSVLSTELPNARHLLEQLAR